MDVTSCVATSCQAQIFRSAPITRATACGHLRLGTNFSTQVYGSTQNCPNELDLLTFGDVVGVSMHHLCIVYVYFNVNLDLAPYFTKNNPAIEHNYYLYKLWSTVSKLTPKHKFRSFLSTRVKISDKNVLFRSNFKMY